MSESTNTENALTLLLSQLENTPDKISFIQVMDVIDAHYEYTPTGFSNGEGHSQVINAAGSNEGSCKIFSFAKLHALEPEKTLQCFGDYYRIDVMANPDGKDHGNIRNFIRSGWAGIRFQGQALKNKAIKGDGGI